MKKFELISTEVLSIEDEDRLSNADYLKSIDDNRSRIRQIASLVISICGMLLSACLVILFFLIRENSSLSVVLYMLYSATFMLIITMVSAVYAILLFPSKPVSTAGEKLQNQIRIYTRERRAIFISLIFFLIAVTSILISLGIFAFTFSD